MSAGYRAVFDALEGTTFEALDRRQLLAVSREIEDRAYRTGSGTLRASFQTLSAFRPQVDPYRELAATNLEVHVYGVADWHPPEIPGVTYHVDAGGGLEPYWALAFDGGDDDSRACGLLARERDAYEGFWTDDAATVAAIDDALASRDVDADEPGSTSADGLGT